MLQMQRQEDCFTTSILPTLGGSAFYSGCVLRSFINTRSFLLIKDLNS